MRGSAGRTLGLALVATVVWAATAEAKTYEVTVRGDPAVDVFNCTPGHCSLREAVQAANGRPGADRILLPKAKRYSLILEDPPEDGNVSGDVDISDPVTIVHPRRGRATIVGNGIDRVLHVQAGAPTALKRIGVTGGDTSDNGGGILTHDRLRLVRSSVFGNVAAFDGGGIDAQDTAPVALIRSNVANNDAGDDGGALNGANGNIVVRRSRIRGNEAAEEAGGIKTTDVADTVTVTQSTVTGNEAGNTAGGFEVESARFVLRRSTVSGNRAGGNGGGLRSVEASAITITSSTISGNRAIDTGLNASGGGLYFDGPEVRITNSTIANNRADDRGGGIHAQDGADVSLNAVTVTRNRAAADDDGMIVLVGGGGLYRLSSVGFDVRNSLIALNWTGAPGAPLTTRNDCQGDTPFDSLGHNLLSQACEGFDAPSDRVRSNPKIGRLKRNGGPTKTVALKKGSAAIGKAHRPSAPNRDQRGRKRDRRPDIGAFERGA